MCHRLDIFDANRYLRGNINFLVHQGSQLNDYERKILKSFKNKSYIKNIITIISICVIIYLIPELLVDYLAMT